MVTVGERVQGSGVGLWWVFGETSSNAIIFGVLYYADAVKPLFHSNYSQSFLVSGPGSFSSIDFVFSSWP